MDTEKEEPADDVYSHSVNEGSDSQVPAKDTHVYSLLFTECDSDQSGWANVNDLILFIKKVLSSSSEVDVNADEESYDSDESTAEAEYNLDLLRRMLECHAVQGLVNEASYNHVIEKWVQDVRSGSPSSKGSHFQEEPDLQDEEELPTHHSSYSAYASESFETTGGGGASVSEIDGSEVIASLEVENKRLVDRNQTLQNQMEVADEQMRCIQIENRELQSKIKSQQQGLALMDAIKAENDDLASVLQQEQKECLDLKSQIENLQQEIRELNTEVSELQNLLTNSNNERDDFEQQTQALQHQLLLKESKLRQVEEERQKLQIVVENQQFEAANLQDALANTSETVQELKTENSQLQSSLSQRGINAGPVSSTPFRPRAPSLQEELIQSGVLPFSDQNGSMYLGMNDSERQELHHHDTEDFFPSALAKARAKIQQRTEQLERGLSELIDDPLGGGGGEKHRSRHVPEVTENYSEVFESKITKLQHKKRKEQQRLQKLIQEVKELRRDNVQLRKKCSDLQRRKQEHDQVGDQANDKQEDIADGQDDLNSKCVSEGGESSESCPEEAKPSICNIKPASSISLANVMVQTDPVLQLVSESAQLLPGRGNEIEIEWVENPLPPDSSLSVLPCEVPHLTTINIAPLAANSVTRNPDSGFNMLRTNGVPLSTDVGENLVPLSESPGETIETVAAAPLTASPDLFTLGRSPDASAAPSIASIDALKTNDATTEKSAVLASPAQCGMDDELTVHSQNDREYTDHHSTGTILEESESNHKDDECFPGIVFESSNGQRVKTRTPIKPMSNNQGEAESPPVAQSSSLNLPASPSVRGERCYSDLLAEINDLREKVHHGKRDELDEMAPPYSDRERSLQSSAKAVQVKPDSADGIVQTDITLTSDELDLAAVHDLVWSPDTATSGFPTTPVMRKYIPVLAHSPTLETNFPPVAVKETSCLSRLGRTLYSLLKSVVWIVFLILLITTLLVVLIEFNGALKQCGGRVCPRSLLHMLLGQNLQYTRNGTVAM